MRKSIILIISFLCLIQYVNSQTVYVYTNYISGVVGSVKIFQDDKKVAKIGNNQWIKIELRGKSFVNFKFKWGLRFNKNVKINFTNKDVAFISIHLDPTVWSVYEQASVNVPAPVWNDYVKNRNTIVKNNRISNHPKSDWTEYSVKKRLTKESDEIEGIYESPFNTGGSIKTQVAVLKENGKYWLIYLSGGDNEYWKVGDIKAFLTETATPYLFKCKWYEEDKAQNEAYLSFYEGMFKIIFDNGNEGLYIKLFPISSQSNKSNTLISGSGFALSYNGYIATNYHVIEEGSKITVKGVNGDYNNALKAIIVATDEKNDLALLKISDPNFEGITDIPYKLNLRILDVGASVFTLGYPLRPTMGDEIKLTNGIISSQTGFQGTYSSYQISAPIQPGNSGSPLFDKSGNVIGIINAKHTNTENVSYAIKVMYLYNLLNSIIDPPSDLSINTIDNLSFTEKVKIVKNFVYIIEVE